MSLKEESGMYASLKARFRRPSAKKVLSSSMVPSPSTPTSQSCSSQITTPTNLRKISATLSVQSAVAETVVDSADAELAARTELLTVEETPLTLWKLHGFNWDLGKRKTLVAQKLDKTEENEDVGEETTAAIPQVELSLAPPPPASEHHVKELEVVEDQEEASSGSRSEETGFFSSPVEVNNKRKRGRPFKGQEKPAEERLVIETCKIRRLIDDILRKGNAESQLCLRLKNIARELDEVLAMDTTSSSEMLVQGGGDEEIIHTLPETLPNDENLQITSPVE